MMEFLYQAENWVFVSFVLFVLAFGKKLWATVAGMLDSRAERIRADLEEAARLREEAAATLSSFQSRQAAALSEAEGIVQRAHKEAEALRVKAEADLEASLKRREQQALDRIAQMEAAAIAEVRNLTVDLAVSASRRLLADGIGISEQDRLVEKAIAEVSARLN
jgi:F-type H+-transporting ATPase subunit b